MSTIEIHHCPRCDLRFTNTSEVEDHLYQDHDVILRGPSTLSDALAVPTTTGQIVVPLDPTRPPPVAARVAVVIARQGSMSVELVASDPAGLDRIATQSYLHRRVREFADTNLSVTCEDLGPREPAAAILDHVRLGGASMVCMDTQSRGAAGELAFGSVSQAVTRGSPVPVLLCGPHMTPDSQYDRIVVGLDGSTQAEGALGAALSLASAIGATVELLEVLDPDVAVPADVWDTAYLSRVASSSPIPIEGFDTVHHRHPSRALADAAARPGTMLAVGTQGRSGFRRLRMGSVAIGAVRHATCPVLVVPPSIEGDRS